jgi:hypothetical protein
LANARCKAASGLVVALTVRGISVHEVGVGVGLNQFQRLKMFEPFCSGLGRLLDLMCVDTRGGVRVEGWVG